MPKLRFRAYIMINTTGDLKGQGMTFSEYRHSSVYPRPLCVFERCRVPGQVSYAGLQLLPTCAHADNVQLSGGEMT